MRLVTSSPTLHEPGLSMGRVTLLRSQRVRIPVAWRNQERFGLGRSLALPGVDGLRIGEGIHASRAVVVVAAEVRRRIQLEPRAHQSASLLRRLRRWLAQKPYRRLHGPKAGELHQAHVRRLFRSADTPVGLGMAPNVKADRSVRCRAHRLSNRFSAAWPRMIRADEGVRVSVPGARG